MSDLLSVASYLLLTIYNLEPIFSDVHELRESTSNINFAPFDKKRSIFVDESWFEKNMVRSVA